MQYASWITATALSLGLFQTVNATPPAVRWPPLGVEITNRRLIESAPIILIARIVAIKVDSSYRSSKEQFGTSQDPRLLEVTLHNLATIKGVVGPSASLFAYGWAGNDRPYLLDESKLDSGLDVYRVGELTVFFLVRERGVLRPLYDFISLRIPVTSGAGWDVSTDKTEPANIVLARILVVPGREFVATEYMPFFAIRDALELTGYEETLAIISAVLRTADPQIRGRICEAVGLNKIYGVRGCFKALGDPATPVAGWKDTVYTPDLTGTGLAVEQEEKLRLSAGQFFQVWLRENLSDGVDKQDFLKMLSRHPNPVVRRHAETALTGY